MRLTAFWRKRLAETFGGNVWRKWLGGIWRKRFGGNVLAETFLLNLA
jgi:hypothetical protein